MDRKHRLLVVEDEPAIRCGLVDVFVFHGFDVDSTADGNEGLRLARSGRFDLILLDVMLPGLDGFSICERLRETDPEQPIILLTARGTDEDIIHGLKLGADDYVPKPFSVAELVLRVQAVLRRARPLPAPGQRLQLGEEVEIDLERLEGRRGAEALRFTRREAEVLAYLHSQRARPVPREELLHKVWGYARDLDIETRTVDIHIAKLRRKIEHEAANPRHLVTIRGAGYQLLSRADDRQG